MLADINFNFHQNTNENVKIVQVKPDDSEPAESLLLKSHVNPHDSIQLKSANQPVIKKENKLENIVFNHQDETTSSPKFIPRYSDDSPGNYKANKQYLIWKKYEKEKRLKY